MTLMTLMTAWGRRSHDRQGAGPLPCWSPATRDAEPRARPNHLVSRGMSGPDRWVSTPQNPIRWTELSERPDRCLCRSPVDAATSVHVTGSAALPQDTGRIVSDARPSFGAVVPGPLRDSIGTALRVVLRLSLRHPLRDAHCLPIRRAHDKRRSTVCSTRPPDRAGGLSVAGRWLGPLNPVVCPPNRRAAGDRGPFAVRGEAGRRWPGLDGWRFDGAEPVPACVRSSPRSRTAPRALIVEQLMAAAVRGTERRRQTVSLPWELAARPGITG